MYNFHSIKELLNALVLGKDLLSEMFGKRKSFDFQYNQAIGFIEESRLLLLIEKGIFTKNGSSLEIEDELLTFFEQILDANEEVNISYINEHVTQLRDNIEYYLTEHSESRKLKYLKRIKAALRKTGFICVRNIVDLNRNIDNTFKTEPNYKIKIKKLENYDLRRVEIKNIIALTEQLINEEELQFFAEAKDDELNSIRTELKLNLQEVRHNLIETEKQIINFLNQVKHQSKIIEKIRQVKYLKDQFELESKSDIIVQLEQTNPVIFENRPTFPLKVSLDILHDDEIYTIIKTLSAKQHHVLKPKVPEAAPISSAYFSDTEETNVFINLEDVKNSFASSGNHLIEFVMQYDYNKIVSFEEMVTCYCQLISLYENEFSFTNEYITHNDTEFSVVYPR